MTGARALCRGPADCPGFACEVSSSTPAGSTLVGAKTMLFTAVQGVRDSGNNGQRPLYNDLFANGAQKLTVNTAKKASAKKVPVQGALPAERAR